MTRLPSLAEIRSLEESLHRAETRGSRAALETLLAEGFVEIGASGSVYDRTAIIQLLLAEEAGGLSQFRSANYVLRPISGDAVLLTYETERLFADGSARSALRSSIWKHDGTAWRMFFHQGTVRA
ncbi:DUF4440 domain-containing protein [Rhizobium sp. AG855]|uniref:nuclear transport factor 2 family protein n=1 Tax=Rhizobium sp. AG855 TaxID=2183898 RepID=UPI000FED0592|nr:DUF4440 domain-containing protein [Rhizobium sp. AG855]RKE84672.1 hypothetical protein DFO46_1443 [Rhizobium sp. AG855]